MNIFILVIFYILVAWSGAAQATVLSDCAAALSPGQFVNCSSGMINLQATAVPPGGFDNNPTNAPVPGPGFDGAQASWDTALKKLYIETSEHNLVVNNSFCPVSYPNYPHSCWKPLWTYDDAINTWTTNGPAPHYTGGAPVEGVHTWGYIAYDNINKTIYVKKHGWGSNATNNFAYDIFRYCASNSPASYCASQLNDWRQITQFNPNSGDIFGQMGWHPGLNGGTLLLFDSSGNNTSCGALLGYREGVGWSTLDSGAGCKFPQAATTLHPAVLSRSKNVMIFGPTGTSSARQWWRINSAGTVAALDPAPCDFTTTPAPRGFSQIVDDPADTGDIIFIGCTNAGKMYRLNPTGTPGSQWTLIDGDLSTAGKICNVNRNTTSECGFDFYATPILTYGVIGFWKFRANSTAEYWLYKTSATSGDIIAPTVSMTAPTAGATVSGSSVTVSATASDNVGVAGVQFKLDGVAINAEDTASPFSISWDTTTASNGSHTLTATARDAAGNTATSTGRTVTVSNVGSDFTTRCNAAIAAGGRCIPFDSPTEIACITWGCNTGLDLGFNGGHTPPSIDTTIKASGSGSIKFVIESQSPANGAGAYFANFSSDLATRYGAGQTFYVQWRQRFSPELLSTVYTEPGGTITGGFKTSIITAGDHTGTCPSGDVALGLCQIQQGVAAYTSCTSIDLPTQNVLQRGFLQAYHSCTGSSSHPFPYTALQRNYPTNTIDFGCNPDCYLQDAAPSPFCLYSQGVEHGGKGYFPPQGGCVQFVANEWMTFKVKFTLGQRGSGNTVGASPNDEFAGSNFSMWIAREGQPSIRVFNFGPFGISAGPATNSDQKFGKIYLQPYQTNKDPNQITPTAYTWYDELIISPQDIADPSGATDTTNPTVAITSPIPPTTSTTTSPIAVSGTATDNVSVTSVTWTCIQCVTKGGTATSSPGTSISWLIPALDLVAGTNTLNVVAHDAAGNVSTAASLTITYAPSSIYWVRPTGTMSGCTPSTTAPATDAGYKSTINAGLSCLAAGNSLIIRSGTYNEVLDSNNGTTWTSGTAATPTIVQAYQGETVTINGGNSSTQPHVIGISNRSFITLNGLHIDGVNTQPVTNQSSVGVKLDSGTNHIQFINGSIVNVLQGWQSADTGTNFNTVKNNDIHDIPTYINSDASGGSSNGIYTGESNQTIEGNRFFNISGYAVQIYNQLNASDNHDNIIKGNLIHDTGLANLTHPGQIWGGMVISGTNHKVFNNIVYHVYGDGIQAYYYGDETSTTFYNNTVYNSLNAAGYGRGFQLNNSVTARNNISINNANGAFVYGGAGSYTADHNLCDSINCDGIGSTNVSDTAANTFVNAATANFHLGSNAFAKDQGVSTLGSPYNVDFDGLPRTSPWDIGAYEFVSSGTSPVVTIVNPTSNPTLSVTQPLFSLGGTSNLP